MLKDLTYVGLLLAIAAFVVFNHLAAGVRNWLALTWPHTFAWLATHSGAAPVRGTTHALLPPDYALAAALKADGWTELYRDKTAVLLTGATY